MERNRKEGQNPPRVLAPIEEEEEENDFIKVETCGFKNILCNKLLCLTGFIPCVTTEKGP